LSRGFLNFSDPHFRDGDHSSYILLFSVGYFYMNVWMNLLAVQPGRNGGVETYCRELLGPLSRVPGLRLTLLCTPTLAGQLRPTVNCDVRVPEIPLPNRLARVFYEQTWLSRNARRSGAELLFCPGYLSPVAPALPTVVSIHDTQFCDIPEMMALGQRVTYRAIIPTAARRAAAIITLSSFSRQQIIKHLRVAPEHVHVTPLASRGWAEVKAWDGSTLPKCFILCVSGSGPHKNIMRLCRAYAAAQPAFAEPWSLVLVGRVPPELDRQLSAVMSNIIGLGYVTDAELASLYHRASAFVFPSLYEGFGLPVIDAMGAGLPVACSNAASLPEVAGGAALLFDPQSEPSIAAALVRLVNEPELRAQLIEKGHRNDSQFSWVECARQTAEVFRSVLAESGASG
jgi:glycosyltransferase involved in cell wall biosynthesis